MDEVVTEYLPRFDKQLQVINQPERTTLLFNGGVGAGKTMTLGDFIAREMLYPDNFIIVAGATMPAMEKATIKKVMEELKARNIWTNYVEHKKTCYFANGSHFIFQTLDVPVKELEGSEIGALVIDEITACPRPQVVALRSRVRRTSPCAKALEMAQQMGWSTEGLIKPGDADWWDYSRRTIFCGNPPEYGHWLEKEFLLSDGGNQAELWGDVISMETYENKMLPADYIAQLEKQYPPGTALNDRMMKGKFGVKPEGAVYSWFDPNIHLVGPDEVPYDKIYCHINAIDLGAGTHDNFCHLRGFITTDRHIYLNGEYYPPKPKVLKEHAMAIRRNYVGGPIYCDWDAQQRLELRALGIHTIPAHKDLVMGIHAVNTRFYNGTLHIVRGTCPNLMREMPGYVWGPGDKPLKPKEGDHALDCMRYIVAAIDLPQDEK